MDFVRIGDKLISITKLQSTIEKILDLRCKGLSQQEVADLMKIHRSFISRLESLGEVHKGKRIAVIGFPIENKEEINKIIKEEGVEFSLLLTEEERWEFLESKSGVELFNSIMDLITKVRSHDVVIIMGSDKRIKIIQALLDKEVVPIEIGKSPLQDDKYVNPRMLRRILRKIKETD